MGKFKQNPRNYVLSIRISDTELEALAQESHTSNKSKSDLMREALNIVVSPTVSHYNNYKRGAIIL
jgi:hypothetical protein